MLDTSAVYKTVLYNDAVFFRLAASTGCSFNGKFFFFFFLIIKLGDCITRIINSRWLLGREVYELSVVANHRVFFTLLAHTFKIHHRIGTPRSTPNVNKTPCS